MEEDFSTSVTLLDVIKTERKLQISERLPRPDSVHRKPSRLPSVSRGLCEVRLGAKNQTETLQD